MSIKNKQPTILDIAKAAGVSKSTVSLALRNSPLSKNETREKIQKLAKAMGYRPNMVFSVMGSGNRVKGAKTNLLPIAYLYDSESNLDTKNLDSTREYGYLIESAHNFGYDLEPYNLKDVVSARKFEQMLFHRGYCGVIIGRLMNDQSIAYDLDLSDFTVVFNTNTSWKHKYHRIIGDVGAALQMAWDKMVAAGYRRIGVAPCRHLPSLPDDDLRVAALLQRQSRDASLVYNIPPFTEEANKLDLFVKWIEKWSPDAVIGFHVGEFYRLKEMGYRIPEDIGFAGLIINPDDQWQKDIAGILNQDRQVSETTISILDQEIRKRIHGIPEYVLSVLVDPQWVEGNSIRKFPSSL